MIPFIRLLFRWGILVMALLAGIVLLPDWAGRTASTSAPAEPARTPVLACRVEQQDVPIYRTGIGSVKASGMVSVVARVEGELIGIAFKEGQEVRAGDVLATIDPRPYQATLRQVEATLHRDQARLGSATADLARATDLFKKGVSTEIAVENQKAAVAQASADVEADQAQRDKALLDLGNTTVRAPIAGRTGLRTVDVGNYMRATERTVITTITQIKPVSVIFTLPEEDITAVNQRLAAGGQLSVSALSRDNRLSLDSGIVVTVDNQIDSKTGTFKVKADFRNEGGRLWPGQFVNARLLLAVRRQGTVVPAPALQRGPDGAYVFAVTADDTADIRPVKVAQVQDGLALIDDGIAPGEVVIVDGQHNLERGSLLTIDHVRLASQPVRSGAPCSAQGPPA